MLETIDTERFEGEVVGVAYGGESPEREVSLETGQALAQALRAREYEVAEYDLPADLDRLIDERPAAVLLAFHGGAGEDGTIQGFLDTLGIPYTGSGVAASALAMDKARAKSVLQRAGLMTPDWGRFPFGEALQRGEDDWREWLRREGLEVPVVVKPTHGGSSQHVAICESAGEIAQSASRIAEEVDRVDAAGGMVEEFVDGDHYTVGFFDDTCLGSLQVVPDEEFYDYEAKYESSETEYRPVEAERPDLARRLEIAGRLAYDALGCRGVARADFIARRDRGDEILHVLEVNTIPGMTASSLVPKLARQQGIGFEEFADLMLSAATCRRG
ncbi:MAG: D-alanine--D-alanine ligase [Bradymonadaceae bacterium]